MGWFSEIADKAASIFAPTSRITPASGSATRVEARVDAAEASIQGRRDAALDAEVAKLAPDQLAAANIKAEQVASQLSTELSKLHVVGNNTDVTNLLRGLNPAEVRLVMQHYQKMGESIGVEQDLETDLRDKLDGVDLNAASPRPWIRIDSDSRPDAISHGLTEHASVRILRAQPGRLRRAAHGARRRRPRRAGRRAVAGLDRDPAAGWRERGEGIRDHRVER